MGIAASVGGTFLAAASLHDSGGGKSWSSADVSAIFKVWLGGVFIACYSPFWLLTIS